MMTNGQTMLKVVQERINKLKSNPSDDKESMYRLQEAELLYNLIKECEEKARDKERYLYDY